MGVWLIKEVLDLLHHCFFINVLGHGQFLNQKILGRVKKLAFAKGEIFFQLQLEEVPENLGHIVDGPGLDLVHETAEKLLDWHACHHLDHGVGVRVADGLTGRSDDRRVPLDRVRAVSVVVADRCFRRAVACSGGRGDGARRDRSDSSRCPAQ